MRLCEAPAVLHILMRFSGYIPLPSTVLRVEPAVGLQSRCLPLNDAGQLWGPGHYYCTPGFSSDRIGQRYDHQQETRRAMPCTAKTARNIKRSACGLSLLHPESFICSGHMHDRLSNADSRGFFALPSTPSAKPIKTLHNAYTRPFL